MSLDSNCQRGQERFGRLQSHRLPTPTNSYSYAKTQILDAIRLLPSLNQISYKRLPQNTVFPHKWLNSSYITTTKNLHKFPFEAIRPQLSWLQGYLDEQITCPPYDMEPFINTILVFGRARTATLRGSFWWRDINDWVMRLNVTLKSINALEHKLELVIRGRGFFVTCSQSPRFIWKNSLTHRDVGRNLDYFAPGHMAKNKPTLAVHMVETGTMQLIVAESILESALDDSQAREGFREFNQQRTILFNSTMQELGLRYRFKCVRVLQE